MRRFFRDVVIFVGINLLILAMLYWRYQISEDYLASANDKLDVLEQTDPPRVLLIGGSSVAWSSHSPIIESDVQRPTLNCAYHAGLGLSFRDREVRRCAKSQDLVVLSIEWGVFPDRPRPRIITELFLAAPRTIQFMNWRDRKLILDGILPTVRMPLKGLAEDFKKERLAAFTQASAMRSKTIRLRSNFNAQGDFVGHYGVPPFGFAGKGMEVPSLEELRDGIDRINQLAEWCESKQIDMVYVIPFIPASVREHNPPLDACLAELRSRLRIPILNPTEFVMPDEGYFDSVYHLREDYGRQRSEQIGKWLASYLNSNDLP